MSTRKTELETQKKLALEGANFRVNSDGWVKRTSQNRQEYLEAPTGDIWELINCKEHPELNGEQLFTWDAAMRETQKAGKRMPTDEEWSILLKTKEDMPNPILAGGRDTNGSFGSRTSYGGFWSSTQYSSSSAWHRVLYVSGASVARFSYGKAYGFSLRCVRN